MTTSYTVVTPNNKTGGYAKTGQEIVDGGGMPGGHQAFAAGTTLTPR